MQVSELKRINQIHKDNEIFARRTLKVPVTPYSVLTELIPSPHPAQAAPATLVTPPTNQLLQLLENNTQKEVPNVQDTSTESKDECAIDCNTIVLNSTLAPSIVPYVDEQMESMSEDTQLLPNKPRDSVEAVVVKQLTSQGADFGIKWFHLVCFVLILVVVVPLVYVMFYLDKHEHVVVELPPLQTNR